MKDHCEALLRLYLRGKTGENYNVGSGKSYGAEEILYFLSKIMKTKNQQHIKKI